MASHAQDPLYATSPKRIRLSDDDTDPLGRLADLYPDHSVTDRGGQTKTRQAGSGQSFWMDSNFRSGGQSGDDPGPEELETCSGKETPPPPPDLTKSPRQADTSEDTTEDGVAEDTTEDGGEEEEEDDDDDTSSTLSTVSNLSGLSDISGREWKPITGMRCAIDKLMLRGINPRAVYSQLTGDSAPLPDTISDLMLWKVIADYFAEIPTRSRLTNISTLDDVVSLLKSCSKIIVLTGAGVSVSCGIPDFRSKDGVYARLAVDFPDLPDPHAMFDIGYFRRDPRPFFKFACEIYPGQFKPSPCHRFIKMLERQNKLLRNYTQNIDTLEKVAGIERVVECHGSFATATCTRCGHSVPSEVIRETVFKQQIPFCPKCSEASSPDEDKGVMKPDIVFFGEGLPESFHSAMGRDKDECDLLIVIGSSLKVQPVSLIPCSLPSHVPQVLINRERLHHLKFDVELLGDSDVIIDHICHILGDRWKEICWREGPCNDCSDLLPDCSPDVTRPDSYYSSSDNCSDTESFEGATALTRFQQRLERPGSGGGDKASADSGATVGEDSKSGGQGGGGCDTTPASSTAGGRHMSLDSSRDSGIGESSNSSNERSPSPAPLRPILVPDSSYLRFKERCYIFPGAEVFTRSPRFIMDKTPNTAD